MKDQDKTKEQLIGELTELHQRVAELEALKSEYEQADKALDDEPNHSAFNLNILLLATFVVILLGTIAMLLQIGKRSLSYMLSNTIFLIFAALILAVCYYLSRKSHVRAGSIIFTVMMAIACGGAIIVGGTYGALPVILIIPVVSASVTLGTTTSLALAALSVVALVIVGLLERNSIIKVAYPAPEVMALLNMFDVGFALFFVTLGIWLAGYSLRQSLGRARKEITERKRAEEELEQSEEKYRNMVELAPDGILTVSLKGVATSCNSAFLELTGFSREEIVGKHISRFPTLRLEDIPKYIRIILLAMRGKIVKPFEFIWVHKDGTSRWGEAHIGLMKKGSKTEGLQLILRDITERKQTEETLRKSEEKYRLIAENVTDVIWAADMNFRFTYVSPSVEHLREYSAEEVMAQSLSDVLAPASLVRATKILKEERENIERGTVQPKTVEFEFKCKDGSTVQTESTVSILYDENKVPVGILGSTRDITERKQAEEALRESHRRLEETLAELKATQEKIIQQERLGAVGQLAAGIAHEFNNILASIALYTQMSLRMPELPPKVRERLEIITEQAEHATDLVKQILDFGRRAILRQKPLDMALLLEETVDLLRHTLPENIKIDLTRGSGEHTISADPERIQQAIVNLALNARDAMLEGGVLRIGLDRLRIEENQESPLPEMEVGEWVQVTVTDTGTGIPPDVLPHIYEPFFTTRAPLGQGLGLAQVYGTVKQHKGHIGVETQIGEGTTFTVYWPAFPVTEPQLETPVTETTDLVQGSNEIILVVEDNHTMRAALIDCLEMLNYQVLEATNSQEALTLFEEHQDEISLVLSDWVMPGIGGLELARALKQRRQDAKVLILTGHSPDQETKDTLPDGVVGWVQKPPQLEQLAEEVARALKEGTPGSQSSRGL